MVRSDVSQIYKRKLGVCLLYDESEMEASLGLIDGNLGNVVLKMEYQKYCWKEEENLVMTILLMQRKQKSDHGE